MPAVQAKTGTPHHTAVPEQEAKTGTPHHTAVLVQEAKTGTPHHTAVPEQEAKTGTPHHTAVPVDEAKTGTPHHTAVPVDEAKTGTSMHRHWLLWLATELRRNTSPLLRPHRPHIPALMNIWNTFIIEGYREEMACWRGAGGWGHSS